ncbi:hypothetical protein L204_106023 [Cryptococcus depauperatus]|nr:COP9 signalosome complex subunit 6 [Cryptococcus depauperatus CBS 7841]
MSISSKSPPVMSSEANSGLVINLHPLAILNISDICTRAQYTSNGDSKPKMIGALLGTLSNHEMAIVNCFELICKQDELSGEDIEMSESPITRGGFVLDTQFLETRKDQFKQVFPTLEVIGWYSIGKEPTIEDVYLHSQFLSLLETPVFLLFNPDPPPESQNLPITIFESAVITENGEDGEEGKFVKLEYGVETGEAERIAVHGVVKGGIGGEEDAAVSHLTTQRNAIRMLYDRIGILLRYVSGVANQSTKPDYAILRHISSLVAALPTMNAVELQEEFLTEYSDIQLSSYLATLMRQLNSLNNYADKHNLVFSQSKDDPSSMSSFSRGQARGPMSVELGRHQ